MSDDDLQARIKAEFREMPDLSLTLQQARRFWATDGDRCAQVLRAFADAGVLERTTDGRYCRERGDVCSWRRREG